MVNIEHELDKIFTFRRDVSDAYRLLGEVYRSQSGAPHTNLRVEDAYNEVYGIAQMLYSDSKGVVIYEYAVDREIRMNGENLRKPFEMVQDCEFHYYGLKLCALAYLYGRPVDKLMIRDTYNDKMIPVRYNRMLAEILITHINRPSEDYEKAITVDHVPQFSLFAHDPVPVGG